MARHHSQGSAFVVVQFELLGPKDRKLVAGPALRGGRGDVTVAGPALRGGRGDVTVSYLSTEGAPRFVPALRAFRAIRTWSSPVLTDGATNFRSFGPKACLRLKLNQHLSLYLPMPLGCKTKK